MNPRYKTGMLIRLTTLVFILHFIQTISATNNISPSSESTNKPVPTVLALADDPQKLIHVLSLGKVSANKNINIKSDMEESSLPPAILELHVDKLLSTPHAVPDSEVFVHGDDVLITGKLTLAGEDLHAKLAKVMMWDADHGVWAIRLGSTGQVVGAKAEKLRKLHKIQLEDLHSEEWTRVPKKGLEAELLSFPKGIEVKIDLSTGEKLVRRGRSST